MYLIPLSQIMKIKVFIFCIISCWPHSSLGLCSNSPILCDGVKDCPDGSDEKNCATCFKGAFACASGGCVSWKDLCNFGPHCSDRSDSLVCNGTHPTAFPTWTEEIHRRGNRNLSLEHADEHVAIYLDAISSRNRNITWIFHLLSRAWKHVKGTYGAFGSDPRLYVILHSHSTGQPECIRAAYRERYLGFRNLIDCGLLTGQRQGQGQGHENGVHAWDKYSRKSFHRIIASIVEIILSGAKGVTNKAGTNSGDHFRPILLYDIFDHLHEEQQNSQNLLRFSLGLDLDLGWMNSTILKHSNSVTSDSDWLYNWYLPIYENYGKSSVLNQFFTLFRLYWAQKGPVEYNPFKAGEFIHFWSGAAGADLSSLSRNVFKWTIGDKTDMELREAKEKYPFFVYLNSTNSTDIYIPVRSLRKTWSGHNALLTLAYADENVAIYYQDQETYDISISFFQNISQAWRYANYYYGPNTPNSTLHIALHSEIKTKTATRSGSGSNKQQNQCISSNDASFTDTEFLSYHFIDCPVPWRNNNKLKNEATTFENIIQEIGRMTLKLSKGTGNWPGRNVSGWSMTSIIVYDIYMGLNRTDDAARWRAAEAGQETAGARNSSSNGDGNGNGKYWLRDWYLKIYDEYEGRSILNKFLNLLQNNVPQKHPGPDYVRPLNTGEFAHFWSGAANANLIDWAKDVVKWGRPHMIEFSNARTVFSGFNYSCEDCDEFSGPSYSKQTKEGVIPRTWTETWNGHTDYLRRVYFDDYVSIYYNNADSNDNHFSYQPATWSFTTLSNLWKYVRETYYGKDTFGENPVLYFVLHVDLKTSTPQSQQQPEPEPEPEPGNGCQCQSLLFQTARYGKRNVIDCQVVVSSASSGFSVNETIKNINKVLVTTLSTFIHLEMNKLVNHTDYHICGDQVRNIMSFDLYPHLNSNSEKDQTSNLSASDPEDQDHDEEFKEWKIEKLSESHNGIFWFRDWFLPIYEQYGGSLVMSRFQNISFIVSSNFNYSDSDSEAFDEVTKNLNMGEFVHLWSGAAGADLQTLAMSAFSWSGEDQLQLSEAKQIIPGVSYSDNNQEVNFPNRSMTPIFNHDELPLKLTYNDEHVAFYSHSKRPHNSALFRNISAAWDYTKKTFYVPSNSNTSSPSPSLLYISIEIVQNPQKPECVTFLSPSLNLNNVQLNRSTTATDTATTTSSRTIACSFKSTPDPELVKADDATIPGAFEKIIMQLGLLTLNSSGNLDRITTNFNHYWPAQDVSGSSMNSILEYDIYLGLGRMDEAARLKQRIADGLLVESILHRRAYWFYKVYKNYGNSTPFRDFFSLLNLYWIPHFENSTETTTTTTNQLNMGEFMHFWSAAAQTSLVDLDKTNLGWNDTFQRQFIKARIAFPGLNYSCENCDETESASTNKPGHYVPAPAASSTQSPQRETNNNNKNNNNSNYNGNIVVIVIVCSVFSLILVILGFGIKFKSYHQKINNLSERIRTLTKEEVEEFIRGNLNTDQNDAHAPIHSMPFNNDFEVPKERLVIDENKILGSGEFGLVKKGMLKEDAETGKPDVVVAVKMVKPNVEVTHFKALLSEIKIMAHLGQHENITSLLGTVTLNIINREVFVALEFCEKGDLLRHLRDNTETFQNLFDARIGKYSQCVYINITKNESVRFGPHLSNISSTRNSYVNSLMSTLNLMEWSRQIASGMAYLASKHVIHGDLAARNVLLTAKNDAKISDFGLSRQLLNYSNYLKKSQTPVPWRWLAIESLSKMTFSVHSDVWSFGVTLWEIFTLGKQPYVGRTWDHCFVDDLIAGDRLNSPQFGNDKIYELMLKCMKNVPAERISFANIISEIDTLEKGLISEIRERHYTSLN